VRASKRALVDSRQHSDERLVQLHVGRFAHPIFREQLHAVPDGFRYVCDDRALGDPTAPTKRIVEQRRGLAPARRLGERVALRALSRAGYVHQTRVRAKPGAALIHSCECLLWSSPLPYVLDFEHAELFVLYQRVALSRPWARAYLLRALTDERLRWLLPWSEAARRSLYRSLGSDAEQRLQSRTRVVYPAVRAAVEQPSSRAGGSLRLLFVGTAFYEKGAVEAIAAVRRLAATQAVHLDLISYVPTDWRARLEGEPAITVHTPGGTDVVQRLYGQVDALLFPTHMDTFGYAALEAMAHGLPVVAPRHLAMTELVEHDISGLLFAPENTLYGEDTRSRYAHTLPPPRRFLAALRQPSDAYVDGIAAALARLAEEPGLYLRLATGAFERVRSGRFSIARRREALGALYAAAGG
jgi:glycosyltransferase involved in cell wall biosynthesis